MVLNGCSAFERNNVAADPRIIAKKFEEYAALAEIPKRDRVVLREAFYSGAAIMFEVLENARSPRVSLADEMDTLDFARKEIAAFITGS